MNPSASSDNKAANPAAGLVVARQPLGRDVAREVVREVSVKVVRHRSQIRPSPVTARVGARTIHDWAMPPGNATAALPRDSASGAPTFATWLWRRRRGAAALWSVNAWDLVAFQGAGGADVGASNGRVEAGAGRRMLGRSAIALSSTVDMKVRNVVREL